MKSIISHWKGEKLADIKKIQLELDEIDLSIIIAALSSAQPISKELEIYQFKLYHHLLFKLNELK